VVTDLVSSFARAAEENAAVVHGPVDAADVSALVARLVGAAPVAVDDDPWLRALGVHERCTAAGAYVLDPRRDAATWRSRLPAVAAGVTGARLAVAELGVVAIAAGPGCPRATSLVPPRHVCVVPCDRIVATLGDAFAAVRDDLPSALTFVGGPSRTGDLEMVTTLGVHGPVRVDLVLVAAPA
jgi:L-lactate dehydrogenase complex protein LldG